VRIKSWSLSKSKESEGGSQNGLILYELEKLEQFEDQKTAIESVNTQIIKICTKPWI